MWRRRRRWRWRERNEKQREHQVKERVREGKGKQAAEFLFVTVCFYFKRKQTNSIGFRSFVHLSIAFVWLPMLLPFIRPLSLFLCALIGNKLRTERVLNFNKYVHFDSFAFQLFALLSGCVSFSFSPTFRLCSFRSFCCLHISMQSNYMPVPSVLLNTHTHTHTQCETITLKNQQKS